MELGVGMFEEMSCQLYGCREKKTLENVSAPLKILKLKGNNRTGTFF